MEIVIFWAVVGGLVGYLCGQSRGQAGAGCLVGAVLGPLGWLLTLCSKDMRPKCRECRGVVEAGARRCRHCGEVIHVMVEYPCPACGEIGMVKEAELGQEFECGVCHRQFVTGAASRTGR